MIYKNGLWPNIHFELANLFDPKLEKNN